MKADNKNLVARSVINRYEFFLMIFLWGINLYYMGKNSSIYRAEFKLIMLGANLSGIFSVFVRRKITLKMFLVYFAILMYSVYSWRAFKNYSFLTIFICMIACENINTDKLLKLVFYSSFSFLVLFQIIGIGASYNTLGLQVSIVILLYISNKKCNLKTIHYIILVFFLVIATVVSTSRSLLLITLIALALCASIKNRIGRKLITSKITIIFFPFCFLTNFFLAECAGNSNVPIIGEILPEGINNIIISFSHVLDKAMNWRLSLTSQSMKIFGFSLLGGNVDLDLLHIDENSYFYIDSGYTIMLQNWGAIFSALFLLFMTIIMYYFVKIKRYDLIISGICIALWTLNEPILNLVNYNFIIFFSAKAIRYIRCLQIQ
jgi:hypothetical protein